VQEQRQRQRQMRFVQHQRELPARRAYLQDMRKMLETEIQDPSGGMSDQTCFLLFDEREKALFEARWSDEYEHAYLGFDDERGRPFESLATLAREQRQWINDLGWFGELLNYPREDDSMSDCDSDSELAGIPGIRELAQVCAGVALAPPVALHYTHSSLGLTPADSHMLRRSGRTIFSTRSPITKNGGRRKISSPRLRLLLSSSVISASLIS
jgi:hypothetical protein